MPGNGRPWQRERGKYRAKCVRDNACCWICKRPIDYDAEPRTPYSFTVDHLDPTSLGSDPMRQDRWKPAHYSCNSARGNGTRRGKLPTSRQW